VGSNTLVPMEQYLFDATIHAHALVLGQASRRAASRFSSRTEAAPGFLIDGVRMSSRLAFRVGWVLGLWFILRPISLAI
jgi:hypothetical protein